MAQRLTKRMVDSLSTSDARGLKIYDSLLPGFCVAVYASGKKTFMVRYGPRGRRRWLTVGGYAGAGGPLTVEQARDYAQKLLAQATMGGDPAAEKAARDAAPTFSQWVGDYLKHVRVRKKSARFDELYLGTACVQWSALRLDEITGERVLKAFELVRRHGVTRPKSLLRGDKGRALQEKAKRRWNKAGARNTTANRWLASVRACLKEAWRRGLIEDLPAMKVRLLPENPPRARVLANDEFQRVMEAILKLEDVHARTALILLVETGARQSEVLHAKWVDVDLENRLWRLPSPKAGRPQVIPLTDSMVALLRNSEKVSEFIIPGRRPQYPKAGKPDATPKPDTPRRDLKRPWAKVQEEARIPDVHLHDIRRTFGLHVARTAGLHVASKLLRHSDVRVTERVYAPLGLEDLRKAMTSVQEERGKVLAMRAGLRKGAAEFSGEDG